MSRIALLLMLAALAACANSDAPSRHSGPGDVQGWRFASGRRPTRIEYFAVVAACRDGAVTSAQGKPLAACLADLGLRRAE
jgi:hypothetical protein